MNREETIAALRQYYEENGIVPDDSKFACKNKQSCGINEKHACGTQCHVGSHYGEYSKILIAALDCGGGEAYDTEERRRVVENYPKHTKKITHMEGTLQILRSIWHDVGDTECLRRCAMLNSCKCCRIDSKDAMTKRCYKHCTCHKIKEIDALAPDVIYFQGRDACMGIRFKQIKYDEMSNLRCVDIAPSLLDGTICYAIINGRQYLAVQCIHPSARGRHKSAAAMFYKKTIWKINESLPSFLVKVL